MPIILALGGQKKEDQAFKSILSYIVSSCLSYYETKTGATLSLRSYTAIK